MAHIAIITGSHRLQGESGRIGRWIAEHLKAANHDAWVLDLAQTPLPLWAEGLWGAEDLKDKWSDVWTPWREKLRACEGMVVVSPEYNGTISAALTNFFHILGAGGEVAHKPGLIVTASASKNGVYPVAELRMASTKNNKLVWIPDHVIIRNCAQMLHETAPPEHEEEHTYVRERMVFSLEMLVRYAEALTAMRAAGLPQDKRFVFGM